MIELNGVSKTYKTKKGVKTLALDNVSFKLPNQGLFFILGKSGSGKSTLLNILGGLDQYDSGEMIVDSKSTKKFWPKDFDYYRNTYIGFIFQEFHLLEEYNVYDNIILSRKLQKEKVSQVVVDDLLNKVGIAGLGKRRINELSGGQKGRVAIARALIKNPEIILADEPTGNLDEETGIQIFTLLKSISREKLVIVVSHDRESALQYADGIIEIADGKIISNSIPSFEENIRTFKAKRSKLPFFSSMKFAFANLGSHKVKLLFTILLVFMSVTFFGISKILSKFDIEKSHATAMKENDIQYITLKKGQYDLSSNRWYNGSDYIPFEKEDIEEASKQFNQPYKLKYMLNEYNENVTLDIDYKRLFATKDLKAYYALIPNLLKFVEADASFLNQKIIGRYPEKSDEIMIHSYLADYIMQAGIALYEENPNQFKKEYYKPTSYEELLEDKYYKLGSTKVKITGIVVDHTEPFQYLKEMSYKEAMGGNNEMWLGLPMYDKTNGFGEIIAIPALDIYVAPGFVENVGLKPNTEIDGGHYSIRINNGTISSYINASYGYFKNKINVFDGEKMVTIDKLGENELIVPDSYLDAVSKNEYSKLKEQYIKNYNEEVRKLEIENKGIREENKKLEEEYEQKLELGEEIEEPTYKEEKEVVYKEDEELEEEFLRNYIKENASMEGMVSIMIQGSEMDSKKETTSNLKIIGFELNGNYVYMPDNVGKEFMKSNYTVNNIMIREGDMKALEKLLRTFPTDDYKFMSVTTYSYSINNVSTALDYFASIAKYASYLFGFFAFILLTNFIVTSIYYNKKVIGILRGLGARKKDIFKIFLNEGLIIGAFSLALSIATLYALIYWVNDYISSHLFFHINFVTFTLENMCILIGSVIGIIFLSSLFTVRKIAKMNPVDAISNK
ncbi:MAG: ATP-binding cassette domain-containing protein [Bacilli bacterium]|nr:ATP-binding cassette domain-containing protein [Bacilli bacterium]